MHKLSEDANDNIEKPETFDFIRITYQVQRNTSIHEGSKHFECDLCEANFSSKKECVTYVIWHLQTIRQDTITIERFTKA